jgi:hypothetical protein
MIRPLLLAAEEPIEFLYERHTKMFFQEHTLRFNPQLKKLEAFKKTSDKDIENEEAVVQYIREFFQDKINQNPSPIQLHNLFKNVSRIEGLITSTRGLGKRKTDDMQVLTDALTDYLKRSHHCILPCGDKKVLVKQDVLLERSKEILLRVGGHEYRIIDASIKGTELEKMGRIITLRNDTPNEKLGNEVLIRVLQKLEFTIVAEKDLFNVIMHLLRYSLHEKIIHYYLFLYLNNITKEKILLIVEIWQQAQARNLPEIVNLCKSAIIGAILTASKAQPSDEKFLDDLSKKCLDSGVDLEIDRYFPDFGVETPSLGILTYKRAAELCKTQSNLDLMDFQYLFRVFPKSKRKSLREGMLPFRNNASGVQLFLNTEYLKLNNDNSIEHLTLFPNLRYLYIDNIVQVDDLDVISKKLETFRCYTFENQKALQKFLTEFPNIREMSFHDIPKTHEQTLKRAGFTKVNQTTFRKGL